MNKSELIDAIAKDTGLTKKIQKPSLSHLLKTSLKKWKTAATYSSSDSELSR